MINFIGDEEVPQIKRLITGLTSFDKALSNPNTGEMGLPYSSGIELFGANHIGKSTFSYSLAGIIANQFGKNIALCDLESFDKKYMETILTHQNFEGTVNLIRDINDETALDKLASSIEDKEYGVGILDTIGAISPISEQESEIGSANMGRRALIVAQFSRRALKVLREQENKIVIANNHWYPRIGQRGYDTPGGEVKKYLLMIRILLKRKESFPDGSFVLEGKVYKNRFGAEGRKFYVFMLAGKGIHKGLTAIIDGANSKKYDIVRSTTVKIGDKSYGYLKNLIEEAHEGNDEVFDPFLEVMNGSGEVRENSEKN